MAASKSFPHAACWPATWPAVVPATGRSLLDADAAAYIALIEGDGVTVSAGQRTAIDAFYRTGKTEGWYSILKRLYLPIWAAAAPNARCLVSGTSGTFAGGVTHASGYVQGNGSTGYFNMGVGPSGLGMTTSTGSLTALVYAADPTAGGFDCMVGAADAANAGLTEIRDNSNDVLGAFIGFGGAVVESASTGRSGLYVANRNASTVMKLHRRTTSGFSTSATMAAVPTAVAAANLYAMGRNVAGTMTFPTDAQLGAYGAGLGFANDSSVLAFTLALKTLWETCTGLTLP